MPTTDMTQTEPQASASAPPSRWLRTFREAGPGSALLVCFPHAGGGANAFSAVAAALPEDIGLLAVQYPGRQDRRAEPCAENVAELAEGAAAELVAYTGRRLFLLGHSMGALVAFETARLLAKRDAVARLFVSAARPPSHDWQEPDLDGLTDSEVVTGVRRLGGVPEPLLDDPETVGELVRVLRGDHRALRRYRAPADAVLPIPVTVLLAEGDPKNSASQVRDWARHSTAGCGLERLPGGHFSLTGAASPAVPLLTRYIREEALPPQDPGDAQDDGKGAAGVRPAASAAPADLIKEILLAGLRGSRPPLSTDLTRLEDAAREVLEPNAFGYVSGSAGTGVSARNNREAFDRLRLVPRMMRGTARRDMSVCLLGRRLPSPVLLAPVAAQGAVHPQGELDTVRGAAAVGLPFILSSFASRTLEEVAAAAGPEQRWFQLYLPTERPVAESLVRRAEASGYTALVVTVDAPSFGYRPADLDAAHSPFLQGIGISNYTDDPAFRATLPADADRLAVLAHWAGTATDPALTWDDLAWLRRFTELPVLVKGVLHPDDARLALEYGADGVVVSNHGGRQLDGSVASLDALPAVRAAVGDATPVLLDSGVRTGSDVLKALALGADAVLLGRPYVYGLALGGQHGVEHVLRCLLADLDLALALAGCACVADVTAELVGPPGDPGAHRP
ncbi:alpha-hydroxy-acid oxidizing protein [Streptomyces sp. NRRL WC-3626]|uniref:alpha-hydroxy-acid oxidizing protein n=1 Tax=Streptomyces sp. NRRL WC-3626 TaxID=1463926 RepID=UPI000A4705C8|nr:alpha-hydroxy-acid oxidizing protein [Streptomyces sp. NRRL WC-3626]